MAFAQLQKQAAEIAEEHHRSTSAPQQNPRREIAKVFKLEICIKVTNEDFSSTHPPVDKTGSHTSSYSDACVSPGLDSNAG